MCKGVYPTPFRSSLATYVTYIRPHRLNRRTVNEHVYSSCQTAYRGHNPRGDIQNSKNAYSTERRCEGQWSTRTGWVSFCWSRLLAHVQMIWYVAMRGWLNDVRSYVPPVAIGEKMRGASLATVIYSQKRGIQAGDIVIAPVSPRHVMRVIWSLLDGWMVRVRHRIGRIQSNSASWSNTSRLSLSIGIHRINSVFRTPWYM